MLGVSHLFYSTAVTLYPFLCIYSNWNYSNLLDRTNDKVWFHFAFHHCFVFNGNCSSYFNNNKFFRKFKMGYGAFYVICPRASSQYVTPLDRIIQITTRNCGLCRWLSVLYKFADLRCIMMRAANDFFIVVQRFCFHLHRDSETKWSTKTRGMGCESSPVTVQISSVMVTAAANIRFLLHRLWTTYTGWAKLNGTDFYFYRASAYCCWRAILI